MNRDMLKDAWMKLMEAEKIIEELWATDPDSRTTRVADAINLIEQARGKLFKERRGRPCTDEEAKAATETFFNEVNKRAGR